MDNLQPFDANDTGAENSDDGAIEAPPQIGTDERRMHVRAYNYWASLIRGAPYPSIEALEPEKVEDFGANSVLLDFTEGTQDPTIAWLGEALREECDVDSGITAVSEVPSRSLLSRLTDHYMQIIANEAPVGFEAEFVNNRGRNTMYRGILMPFSSTRETIDFIYGVINWKEVADRETEDAIRDEFASLAPDIPAHAARATPVWADGPSSGEKAGAETAPRKAPVDLAQADPESLADWLVQARASAGEARDAEHRSRAALYRALGDAYDFALATDEDPEGYAELLGEAGITRQARAPMTPIVKLVFGADYDKRRLTEFAAALSFAKREGIAGGGLADYLAGHAGGLKAIVAAERAFRRPAGSTPPIEAARDTVRAAPVREVVAIDTPGENEEFALLVARRMADGRLGIVGALPHDGTMVDRAVRKLAG